MFTAERRNGNAGSPSLLGGTQASRALLSSCATTTLLLLRSCSEHIIHRSFGKLPELQYFAHPESTIHPVDDWQAELKSNPLCWPRQGCPVLSPQEMQVGARTRLLCPAQSQEAGGKGRPGRSKLIIKFYYGRGWQGTELKLGDR